MRRSKDWVKDNFGLLFLMVMIIVAGVCIGAIVGLILRPSWDYGYILHDGTQGYSNLCLTQGHTLYCEKDGEYFKVQTFYYMGDE